MTERRDILDTRYLAEAALRFTHAKAEARTAHRKLRALKQEARYSLLANLKAFLPEKYKSLPIRYGWSDSSIELAIGPEDKSDESYNVSCADGERIRVIYIFFVPEKAMEKDSGNDDYDETVWGIYGSKKEAQEIEDALRHPRCYELKWALTGLALLTDVERCHGAIKLE